MRFGIAANPATAISSLATLAGCADFITLLSTEPDGAGELMLPGTEDRVRAAGAVIGMARELEVDGGVNPTNAPRLATCGANRLVAGRVVLEATDPAACVAILRSVSVGALA
jgi:pentose-5-phosphate-3-epimerase